MEIEKMLAELREERELVDGAIIALERLARGGGKRRGRPPKWMLVTNAVAAATTPDHPKKRRFSAEARKHMAEAQRRRWAARQKPEGE